MNLIGKYAITTKEELNKALRDAELAGKKTAKKAFEDEYADKFEQQEKTIKARNKTIKLQQELNVEQRADAEREIEKLEAMLDVLEEDRDNVRSVIKKEMELNDRESIIDGKKESLDRQAADIKSREEKITSKEESNFQKGYADGISDGLRKISEITAKDRDSAMKIAMVAASSHTPIDNLKEINNVHRIASGGSDSEA